MRETAKFNTISCAGHLVIWVSFNIIHEIVEYVYIVLINMTLNRNKYYI